MGVGLAHVPKVGVRIAKLGLGPGKPDAALPRVVGLMVAGDEFSAGGIDGVQMGAVFEDGVDAFWDIAGFHLVVQDGGTC